MYKLWYLKAMFTYNYYTYQIPYKKALMKLDELTKNADSMTTDEIRKCKEAYLRAVNIVRRKQAKCEKFRNEIQNLKLQRALQ